MIPKKRDKIGMPVSYQRDGYRVNEEIPVGILLDSAGPTLISPTSIRVVKTPSSVIFLRPGRLWLSQLLNFSLYLSFYGPF
jgi:hypothetical protein